VCIVKEDVEGEIEAFERAAWAGGEILLDEDMDWFKAVGGGTLDRKSLAAWMVRALALPFTRARANLAHGKGVEGNLLGEGMITGGAYVVAQGGEVQWSFREAEIGDGFDVDEVVAAVHALGGIKTRTGQQPTTERP